MVASGVFLVELRGGDEATGLTFNPLGSSIKNMRRAHFKDRAFLISDQNGTPFVDQGDSFAGGIYQGLDYLVFHIDIRENE